MTHYHGTAATGLPELFELKEAAAEAKAIEVILFRQGETIVLSFAPGPLGLFLMPVTEGEAVEPLPPATDVTFDFSSLKDAPRDEWLVFSLDGKTTIGFEHHLLRLEDGKLHLRREVAFDGAAWGLNHFDVTVVATAAGMPETLRTTAVHPLVKAEWKGELVVLEDTTREWHIRWTRGEESGESSVEAPARLIAEYMVESLAGFMPRKKGACLHFRPLGETSGGVARTAALLSVGEEDFELDGKTVKVWRIQHVLLGGQVASQFLVDGAGRVVFSDYNGAQATLSTKEKVLATLHEKLRPRSVK